MRYFSEEEVRNLLSMEMAISAVEEALRALSTGRAIMPTRTKIDTDKGDVLTMPAYLPGMGTFSVKIVSVYPDNPKVGLPLIQAISLVLDASSGKPIAAIESNGLTAIRTGAASGVATKYLAGSGAEVAGIIGSGTQAWTQLLAVIEVRPIREVRVFSPNKAHREGFARRAIENTGLECRAVGSAEEAIRGADVIITATTSSTPVIKREWIKDGAHINAIGSYKPDKRELDTATILSSKVIVDHLESAKEEAGDLIIPIKEGVFSWDKVYAELGEILAGSKPGRVDDREVTLFKSVGLAVEDAAVAAAILRRSGML